MNNDRFKFRVWSTKHNCYQEYCSFDLTMEGRLIDGAGNTENNGREDLIIEQCTGLKDKSTNLIYANDLIKSPNNSNLLVVKQEENGLWQPYEYNSDGPLGNRELPLFDLVRLYGVEIVGNIHERKDEK